MKINNNMHNNMDSKEPLISRPRVDGLTPFKTFVFGIGHFLNDLASASWFNYGLFYLVNLQKVSTVTAGMVFLVGQIADSFSTPLVGYLSDRFNSRIGKRTPWYILGTILMPICHSLMYQDCYACKGFEGKTYLILEVVWYSAFTTIDNIGWASVQISHMSLIPALSPSKEKRNQLIGYRNAFTFIANILVLVTALFLFNVLDDGKQQFMVLVVSLFAFGIATNILFLIVINERQLCAIAENSYRELGGLLQDSREPRPGLVANLDKGKMTIRDWLRKPQLYWIGMLYNMARLANNYTTAMIPFYLVYVIGMGKLTEDVTSTPWQLAVVPLLMYISSMFFSFIVTYITRFSRKTMFFIGSMVATGVAVAFALIQEEFQYAIMPVVLIAGGAFSVMLNTSMGLISAFVGEDAKSGAVVWGMLGFVDKLTSGLTVFLVTNLGNLHDSEYVRNVTFVVLLTTAIVGGVCSFFIKYIPEFSEKSEKEV